MLWKQACKYDEKYVHLVLAFKLLPTVQYVQYSHVNITLTVCNIYSVYKAHII